jgi:hypothetical protein
MIKISKISDHTREVRMKRLIIFCILILAFTNQAYAMGRHGGGGGGGSSASAGSGGTSNTTTASSTTNNSATYTASNTTTGGNIGATEGQGAAGSGGSNFVLLSENGGPAAPTPAPEPTTMFLLGSAMFGLWALLRKVKK